jgi:hypothetical protein
MIDAMFDYIGKHAAGKESKEENIDLAKCFEKVG